MKVEIRAATTGYLLRLWNVDCLSKAKKKGQGEHLFLKNKAALYGVENLVIAPGYHDETITDDMER